MSLLVAAFSLYAGQIALSFVTPCLPWLWVMPVLEILALLRYIYLLRKDGNHCAFNTWVVVSLFVTIELSLLCALGFTRCETYEFVTGLLLIAPRVLTLPFCVCSCCFRWQEFSQIAFSLPDLESDVESGESATDASVFVEALCALFIILFVLGGFYFWVERQIPSAVTCWCVTVCPLVWGYFRK